MEKIEDEMAGKQNDPHFDAAAIHAKQKKVKGIKMSGKDRATDSGAQKTLYAEPLPPQTCLNSHTLRVIR